MTTVTALVSELPAGRDHPIPARRLGALLGVSERKVGEIVAEAIATGYLIGSTCEAGRAGYFAIRQSNWDDLDVGTRHIRARAFQSLARVRHLERSAARSFGPEALQLFALDGNETDRTRSEVRSANSRRAIRHGRF